MKSDIPDEWFSDEEMLKNIEKAERTNGLAGRILDSKDICVMSKVRGLAHLACDRNITFNDVLEFDVKLKRPIEPKSLFNQHR